MGNYRSFSVALALGDVMEQITWSSITQQAQPAWIYERFVLPADIVDLDFSRALDNIFPWRNWVLKANSAPFSG